MVRQRMRASSSSWSLPGSVMMMRGTVFTPVFTPAWSEEESAEAGCTACCSLVLSPRSCLGSDCRSRCAAPLTAAVPVSTPMYTPCGVHRSTLKPTVSRLASRRHATAATRATQLRLTTGVQVSKLLELLELLESSRCSPARCSPVPSRAARALRKMSHSAASPEATAE